MHQFVTTYLNFLKETVVKTALLVNFKAKFQLLIYQSMLHSLLQFWKENSHLYNDKHSDENSTVFLGYGIWNSFFLKEFSIKRPIGTRFNSLCFGFKKICEVLKAFLYKIFEVFETLFKTYTKRTNFSVFWKTKTSHIEHIVW